MGRLLAALWWVTPSLLCLALYWNGLLSWFAQDDFAWLGLRLSIFNFHDFLSTMFAPKAQGTIRPLSERGFFLLFEWLFGFNALPYRIFVFATQFANLALLASIARRLTGSRTAGWLAPVLWMVNGSLSGPLSWTSSYNQILWAFFLLASFRFWILYVGTGRTRYYAAQWVTFLLGFGALELNVVYPAIAAAYALISGRRYLLRTVPMFAVSAGYALLHNAVAPKQREGIYGMHYDLSLWGTLGKYVRWALGLDWLKLIGWQPGWALEACYWVLLTSIVGYLIWKLSRREWLPLFCLAWFVLVLGPVLPLRDHVSGYYLTVPAIGLGLLLASAAVDAWRRGWLARGLAILLIGLYVWSSATFSWRSTLWQRERSSAIRNLIGGIVQARELHPNSLIVLAHVSPDGFWAGLAHKPLRLLGIRDVYLAPEAAEELGGHPELGDVRDFMIPKAVLQRAILNNSAVVYDASSAPLRSITTPYGRKLTAQPVSAFPDRVEPGNPIFAAAVGEGWYAPEYSYRWMSKRATLKLTAPNSAVRELHLSGYAPGEILDAGGLPLQVRVDGKEAGTIVLRRGDESFERDIPLHLDLAGKSELSIEIECGRTFRPSNDQRDLCIAVSNVAIR